MDQCGAGLLISTTAIGWIVGVTALLVGVACSSATFAVGHLGRVASVREIGDGNLNLVFLLKYEDGWGLYIKLALPYVRMTGEGRPMTPDRATP